MFVERTVRQCTTATINLVLCVRVGPVDIDSNRFYGDYSEISVYLLHLCLCMFAYTALPITTE